MSYTQVVPFGSLYLEPSRNGLTRPKSVRGNGYKMINMGELFAHPRISDPPMERVPMSASEIERFAVAANDLLFARQSLVAAGAGKCCIVCNAPETTTFESHLIRVRLDSRVADPLFYFYYFASPQGTANVQSIVMQVAAAGIRGSELAELYVPCPEIAEQRRIASILSAYDDLIENNTRRIAILEEMARRIYEEWFVHFRFPGREQVRMVESELGLVPEGWKVVAVEEVMETLGGGTPSKKEPDYWESGDINWYAPVDLTGAKTVFMEESRVKINQLGLAKSSARMFPVRSVMMTSRATIGVIAVNTTEACTNQGFITCVPSECYPLWLLYHWLKVNVETFEQLGTGATFKEITKGVFRKLQLAVPPPILSGRFESTVRPMMDLVLTLERANRNLRTTRDLLLPRLISGELDVSEMPEPEAVAA